VDRHVRPGRDDEHHNSHRGQRAQQAVRPRAVPAGLLGRREPLGDEPDPIRHVVERVLEPGRRAQDELGGGSLGPGEGHRSWLPQASADALEPVAARLERVGRGVQRSPQVRLVVCVRGHASRSRTVRNACMALAVWLFTAPRLIRMASAIWASDISA
jgi:hypothetical protein